MQFPSKKIAGVSSPIFQGGLNMTAHRIGRLAVLFISGFALLFTSACSLIPSGAKPTPAPASGGVTFTAPSGYAIKEYTDYVDQGVQADYLYIAQKKPIYFQVFRKQSVPGEDLDTLFDEYVATAEPEGSHFQLISRKEVEFSGRPAVEFVFGHFHGEPYVRTRSIWIEAGDLIFILSCSQTISADKAGEPVSAECDRLQEGFKFE
jgi:hypothetical protein